MEKLHDLTITVKQVNPSKGSSDSFSNCLRALTYICLSKEQGLCLRFIVALIPIEHTHQPTNHQPTHTNQPYQLTAISCYKMSNKAAQIEFPNDTAKLWSF